MTGLSFAHFMFQLILTPRFNDINLGVVKSTIVRLPNELHKKLKIRAVECNTTLQQIFNDAVLAWLEANKPDLDTGTQASPGDPEH